MPKYTPRFSTLYIAKTSEMTRTSGTGVKQNKICLSGPPLERPLLDIP